MDRSWNVRCVERSCRHAPEEHLATPELAQTTGEHVIFCRTCRRHETVRPSRLRWRRAVAGRAA